MLEIWLKQIKNIKSQQRKRGYQKKTLELKKANLHRVGMGK